mmetsp:Transcript_28744/g.42570  ORF Transcript_28744/g.42570 Transcript_28744/m.42570 type:complete len:107 (+) Transcript_28744:962-1282(+)
MAEFKMTAMNSTVLFQICNTLIKPGRDFSLQQLAPLLCTCVLWAQSLETGNLENHSSHNRERPATIKLTHVDEKLYYSINNKERTKVLKPLAVHYSTTKSPNTQKR